MLSSAVIVILLGGLAIYVSALTLMNVGVVAIESGHIIVEIAGHQWTSVLTFAIAAQQ